MALAVVQQDSGRSVDGAGGTTMVLLVVFLFFTWGFVTVLNDPLIAKLKGLFKLNYAEAMLTQFAFFLGYLVFSIPAGIVLRRVGYVRSIVLGLIVMALGCLGFSPAAMSGVYVGFLVALFFVAAGIALLQVAANPYIAALGANATRHSRLTLAQAFNSLGTFLGPFVGALFLLKEGIDSPGTAGATALGTSPQAEAATVQAPFLVIAAVLLLFALLFWLKRDAPAPRSSQEERTDSPHRSALHNPRLICGVVSIFVYVGAEVSIGSGLTNYLMQPSVLGAQTSGFGDRASAFLRGALGGSYHFNAAQIAGTLVSIYWGLAMVGRFIGSWALARVSPGGVLCCNASIAAVLAVASAHSLGVTAAATVLAIGLANSIMFPTIFALALEGLGEETANASALLCMAIVGGAIVPLIYGATADALGLARALIVPACCYGVIALYGLLAAQGLLPVDRRG